MLKRMIHRLGIIYLCFMMLHPFWTYSHHSLTNIHPLAQSKQRHAQCAHKLASFRRAVLIFRSLLWTAGDQIYDTSPLLRSSSICLSALDGARKYKKNSSQIFTKMAKSILHRHAITLRKKGSFNCGSSWKKSTFLSLVQVVQTIWTSLCCHNL